jgi:hypothetical protein
MEAARTTGSSRLAEERQDIFGQPGHEEAARIPLNIQDARKQPGSLTLPGHLGADKIVEHHGYLEAARIQQTARIPGRSQDACKQTDTWRQTRF